MPMIDAILGELEQEDVKTRKVLERIPTERFGWKPHERSMSMGQLASHVVETLGWGAVTLTEDGYDMPAEFSPWQASSSEELLKQFESNLSSVKQAMQSYPDSRLSESWTLSGNGQVFFSLPRAAVLRSMILNHQIHHRGQLSVYLRLNDIPVPAIYGPSADEQS